MVADTSYRLIAIVAMATVTIVRGKENESLLIQVQFVNQCQDVTDGLVQSCDHARPFLVADCPGLITVGS